MKSAVAMIEKGRELLKLSHYLQSEEETWEKPQKKKPKRRRLGKKGRRQDHLNELKRKDAGRRDFEKDQETAHRDRKKKKKQREGEFCYLHAGRGFRHLRRELLGRNRENAGTCRYTQRHKGKLP